MLRASLLGKALHARALLALLSLVAGVCLAPDAHAYAWFVRHGYAQCSTCHVDPSGGELLTQMGRVQSQTLLSVPWSGSGELTRDALALQSLDEPDWLRVGGSLRYMALGALPKQGQAARLKHFPMQADVYGAAFVGSFRAGLSLGYASIPENSPHLRAAQVFQKPSGPNLISRTHWLGYAFSERVLLRAGRLNLPFGVRVSEHVLWARESTATDRESDQQHGLALAGWGPRLRWEGMLVAGNLQTQPDRVRERGYSGYAEYSFSRDVALGMSSLLLGSEQSILTGRTQATVRQAHGITLRAVPLHPLVVLAEADVLATSGRSLGYTGFAKLDLEPTQGLHLAASGELLDLGARDEAEQALPGSGKATSGFWLTLHWFPLPHWDLQLDFVTRYPFTNNTVQAQLHYYL